MAVDPALQNPSYRSGTVTIPSAPNFAGIPFLQTYGGQPAPYNNINTQIADALRLSQRGAGQWMGNAAQRYAFNGPYANPAWYWRGQAPAGQQQQQTGLLGGYTGQTGQTGQTGLLGTPIPKAQTAAQPANPAMPTWDAQGNALFTNEYRAPLKQGMPTNVPQFQNMSKEDYDYIQRMSSMLGGDVRAFLPGDQNQANVAYQNLQKQYGPAGGTDWNVLSQYNGPARSYFDAWLQSSNTPKAAMLNDPSVWGGKTFWQAHGYTPRS